MSTYLTVDPTQVEIPRMHGLLLGAITPRPIAFASTIDKAGKINLSPFSYFNVFSTRPPIMIFSPARSGRDNTTKHTLDNVLEVPEVVINVVDYSMVQQVSLASTVYPKGVNEFVKAGFTEIKSTVVNPPRVAESPAAFECKVNQVIPLGNQGGAGNLVICEVLLVHYASRIFDDAGQIDPQKLDAVGRMGGNWYARASGEAVFEVPKPSHPLGIGVDQLPKHILNSPVLTGNDLGKLGNISKLPDPSEVEAFRKNDRLKMVLGTTLNGSDARRQELHRLAAQFLKSDEIEKAWKTLLQE